MTGAVAVRTISAFHQKLCATRVLDPACGTGNFLYVSLELVKRLEGEVLEALSDLGGQEALGGTRGAYGRSTSVHGHGAEPACCRHRGAGFMDWPSAMAHSHQGRHAGGAHPAGLQEYRGQGRCA